MIKISLKDSLYLFFLGFVILFIGIARYFKFMIKIAN